jgi:hypothetical protein
MGWKEGSGLGKEGQGIAAPIQSIIKLDKKGLGSAEQNIAPKEKKRLENIEITRRRYEET